MIKNKLAFVATTALVGSMMLASSAYAQSTGTTEVDAVVVTAEGQKAIEGVVAETAPKARTTITQEYIDRQGAGQTILQTLNLTPGLNFVNNDPYGSSGGNIRLRGFDGNRISLTFDGIPLNDTGNYAIYSNQQLDGELITQANVITGATDVDTPTISATGGVINYTVRKPSRDFGGMSTASVGSFNYRRIFGLVETGEFGPFGTRAWFSASYQNYDKFKGKGDLEKKQFNARIWQDLAKPGDFVSLAIHWNENRNFAYYSPNLGTSDGLTPSQITTLGWDVDYDGVWTPVPAGVPGVADQTTSGTDPNNSASTTGPTGWWGGRINPSNTGNIRLQSRYTLTDYLTLTFDPSFQYVMANGGSQHQTVFENDRKLIGDPSAVTSYSCVVGTSPQGVDLNGDGDCMDRIHYMSPSNTNTRRYGLNTSLIWEVDDQNTLRLAYTYDKGRHRQTSEGGFVNQQTGFFEDWFGGKETWGGRRLESADGAMLRFRDRFSVAELSQLALEYRGRFFDNRLRVIAGVQYKEFSRELNQYCYTQNNSSTALCTTQPVASTLPNGNVTFAGNANNYIPPFSYSASIDKVLPNVSASWTFDSNNSVYASYSEQISALRTDSYYYVYRNASNGISSLNAQPEGTKTWEVGYRYQSRTLLAQTNVYYTNFENRVVSTFDEDLNAFVERNVGSVITKGFEGSIGWSPTEKLSMLGSVTYTSAEYQDDLLMRVVAGVPRYAPISGKQLVETPTWMSTARVGYDFGPVLVGLQAKYVGERFATDMNDMAVKGYTLFDLDARWNLESIGVDNAYLQLNIWNLTDKRYLGNLGTQVTANTADKTFYGVSSQPYASVGAPRTVQLSLRLGF